jgi:hypothetical protein
VSVRRRRACISTFTQSTLPRREWARSALLLGTALAALSAGGLLKSAPAAAVDQIIVNTQTQTAGDTKSVNNSTKLTTTLEELISNATLALSNSHAAANSGVPATSLYQLIDLTQQILVNNDISIINSGNIDPPAFGIYAQINNTALAFANSAAESNENGSTVSGDVTQIINIDQISSVAR